MYSCGQFCVHHYFIPPTPQHVYCVILTTTHTADRVRTSFCAMQHHDINKDKVQHDSASKERISVASQDSVSERSEVFQDRKDKLSKYLSYQRRRYSKDSIATIPEQGSIEDVGWLMQQKDRFENSVQKMHSEWIEFLQEKYTMPHKFKWNDKTIQEIGAKFRQWQIKYNVDMLQVLPNPDLEPCHYKSWDEIDFRPTMKLYDDKEPTTLTSDCISDLAARLLANAQRIHFASKGVSTETGHLSCLTEVRLVAWGTHPQPIHCDFTSAAQQPIANPADDPPGHTMPCPLSAWFGTIVYRFVEKGAAADAAPTIGWVAQDKGSKRPFKVEDVECGYATLYGPNFQHCGGASNFPHICLYAYFENPESGFLRRVRALPLSHPVSKNTTRMRKLKLARGKCSYKKLSHLRTFNHVRKMKINTGNLL